MNTAAPNPPEAKPPIPALPITTSPVTAHDGNGHDATGHGHDSHGHAAKAALDEHDMPTNLPRPSGWVVAMVGLLALLLLGAMFLIGYIPHHSEQMQIDADARAITSDVPIVQADYPTKSKPETDILLPASARAWQQTALYPRALGYLAKVNHDIGDHVKAGDVLAVISAPDIDAQLRQNQANLEQGVAAVEKAKADVTIAKNTYQRYQQWMNTTAGVSQQDLEDKKSAYADAIAVQHQAEASVDALRAAVQQLQVSQSFEKIVAPFTGIVTARNYDVGALMSPSNTSAKPMFDMAQTDWLRVFIAVPQSDANAITTSKTAAYLTVRNFPGHEFQGWVGRAAGAVDPTTRTETVEVDIPNADGLLSPGMYGTMRLPIGNPHPALVVPTSALVFDAAGLRVAIVKDNAVHFARIKAGRDYGTTIEVTDGITATDQIIADPSEQLDEGTKVQIQQSGQAAQPHAPKVARAN